MTGFNLPPGCRTSDIPGNSASDVRYAQLYEGTYERLLDGDLATELSEKDARDLLETLVCWIVPVTGEQRDSTEILNRLIRSVTRSAQRRAEELTEAYLEADDRR